MKVDTSSILVFVTNFAIFCICKVSFSGVDSCGWSAVVKAGDVEEDEQNLDMENDSGAADQSLSKVNEEMTFEDQAFSSILSSGASAAVLPPVERCRAAKAPKSSQYLSYNPRYQAITIDEAVLNFVDLTEQDGRLEKINNLFGGRPKFFDQQSGPPNGLKLKCDSTLCSDCAGILASKLEYNPEVERIFYPEDILAASDTVVKQGFTLNFGGRSNGRDKPYCPLLNKTMKNYQTIKRLKIKSSELNKILDIARISRNTESKRSIPRIIRDIKSPQSRTLPLSMIGKSVKVDCNYHRGDRLDEKTNLCGLCNLCWTIRLLPDKYYPRFVNEVTCDKNATRCLSGHGICREKFRNLVALIDVGSDPNIPKWEQVDVTTSIACECFIYQNSALYGIAKN